MLACIKKYSKKYVQGQWVTQNIDILTLKILKIFKFALNDQNRELCPLPWKPTENEKNIIIYFVSGQRTINGQTIRKIYFFKFGHIL